eukprot:TRINITY_DN552_c1_g2_i1.p1 TRINITY_DN552_c1_g2~~TRINITY_DN552_c1_g2_i1.p1  ORF type:complete len:646 (-),score=146.55 TRINITY_DN552_c1_g2_i1:166-1905(-)
MSQIIPHKQTLEREPSRRMSILIEDHERYLDDNDSSSDDVMSVEINDDDSIGFEPRIVTGNTPLSPEGILDLDESIDQPYNPRMSLELAASSLVALERESHLGNVNVDAAMLDMLTLGDVITRGRVASKNTVAGQFNETIEEEWEDPNSLNEEVSNDDGSQNLNHEHFRLPKAASFAVRGIRDEEDSKLDENCENDNKSTKRRETRNSTSALESLASQRKLSLPKPPVYDVKRSLPQSIEQPLKSQQRNKRFSVPSPQRPVSDMLSKSARVAISPNTFKMMERKFSNGNEDRGMSGDYHSRNKHGGIYSSHDSFKKGGRMRELRRTSRDRAFTIVGSDSSNKTDPRLSDITKTGIYERLILSFFDVDPQALPAVLIRLISACQEQYFESAKLNERRHQKYGEIRRFEIEERLFTRALMCLPLPNVHESIESLKSRVWLLCLNSHFADGLRQLVKFSYWNEALVLFRDLILFQEYQVKKDTDPGFAVSLQFLINGFDYKVCSDHLIEMGFVLLKYAKTGNNEQKLFRLESLLEGVFPQDISFSRLRGQAQKAKESIQIIPDEWFPTHRKGLPLSPKKINR